jgi:replicative DNA helicase
MNYDKKKRGGSVDLSTVMYGKVQPQAKDLEIAVIGALLIEKSAIYQVSEYLTPEVFYSDAHQRIYRSILNLHRRNAPVDLLTVTEELRVSDELEAIGGGYYLLTILQDIVSSAHLEHHARIIIEKYIKREMIRNSGEILSLAYEDSTDSFSLIDSVKTSVSEIDRKINKAKVTKLETLAFNVIDKITNRVMLAREGKGNPDDIFTGIAAWDEINGALFNGLYVIAGRPGMGKGVHMTECVCQMSVKNAVGVINGEMTNEQLMIRMGCNIKGIDNYLWKQDPRTISDDQLTLIRDAMEVCVNQKVFISDELEIHHVCSKIRYWVEHEGVKAVFIDFLTLLTIDEEKGKYWTDRQKVNYIMDELRKLCKVLKIPIFLYAQLNRALLQRASKEPNLGDLKESGNIEEYAFQISFLHRPEYYDETGVDEFGESVKGLLYQIIAKHRDGMLGRVKHLAILKSSKLMPWNDNSIPSISILNIPSFSLPAYNNQQPRNVSGDDGWPTIDEKDLI